MAGPRRRPRRLWRPEARLGDRTCVVRQGCTTRGAAPITRAACLLGVLLVAAQAATRPGCHAPCAPRLPRALARLAAPLSGGPERVEDVLAEMRRHQSDAWVQWRGCNKLESLAGNDDNRIKIADAGGIADVLAAMRAHRSHVGVQEMGCGALWNLDNSNADNRIKISDAGVIADVLAAMRAHRSHAGVQARGCGALWSLDVLAEMRRHKSNAEVQERGLEALWILAAYSRSRSRFRITIAEIVDTGAIADVLAAMREHRSHARVQEQGCGALWRLADDNVDNRIKIVAAGGIADVLAAMRRHWWHPLVQLMGFLALCLLDFNAAMYAVEKRLATGLAIWVFSRRCDWYVTGLLGVLLVAAQAGRIPGLGPAQGAERVEDVLAGLAIWVCYKLRHWWHAACLLGVLLMASQTDPTRGAERVEDVLAEMRRHKSDTEVLERACGALWSLSYSNVDNSIKIADAGGIADVLAAMREHKGNSGVEHFACLTLHNLGQSANGQVSESLLELGAVPAARAATSGHCKWWGQKMTDRPLRTEAYWIEVLEAQRAFQRKEAEDNKVASFWKLLATGLAIWVCSRFIWRREAGPPANPGRAQAPEVPADRLQPAANADAQADAQRITATARVEAQRITATARQVQDAARAEAHARADAAQADARRITAAARVEAQRTTAAAQEAAQEEAQRITAAAWADAQHITAAAREAARDQTSVAIFFRAELAAATGDFADAHCIGSGGFGSVYHASRLRGLGGGGLAIKKLDMASMQGQTEFLQEVQVLGACRHKNLTPLLGFAADAGPSGAHCGVCLVTPLMRGGSLADRLTLDGEARGRLSKLPGAPAGGFAPLSWQQRLVVAVDAVRGLLFLHTPDADTHRPAILHHDLKPSNILLDLDGHARLADMGLARAQRPEAAHLTTSMTIYGTNGYVDGHYQATGQYDMSSDGFSLGVTLLELLTGWPALDRVRGRITDRCSELDDASEVADERAQWPRAVADEMHKVGMDLVKPNRARRITLSAALQRLQQLVDAHRAPASAPEDLVGRECMICQEAPRHVRFGW